MIRQHSGIVGAHLILLDETRAFGFRQLRHALSHFGQQNSGLYRHKIGIREVAIIMRELFCAHKKRFAGCVIPTTCLLLKCFAVLQRSDLTPDLVGQRASHPAD